MPGRDIIGMSVRELKRLKVAQEAIAGQITQAMAAEVLRLSERQVRRLVRAIRAEGERGVAHKARGKLSNRRIASEIKAKALLAYKEAYTGFGPTLAAEKLWEREGIEISKETLRKWLTEEGLWSRNRKSKTHRRRRERKECFGQMVQLDGSHHDWLEGRGPKMVLMGYIDDATGNVFGRFYDYEGTIPAMDSFKRYIKKCGLPHSIYVDKHATYKSTKPIEEDELEDRPMSQFERALTELGVEVIHANSPQAKGRVERLFGTLQDRLVKEMRLRGIASKDEANVFLNSFLPAFNKKFRVAAASRADMHTPLPKGLDLDDFLCIKTNRVVKNDNTVPLNGKLFQIEEPVDTTHVEIQERIDGKTLIKAEGRNLKYTVIEQRPKPKVKKSASRPRRAIAPPKTTHPWKRWQDSKPKSNWWAYAY